MPEMPDLTVVIRYRLSGPRAVAQAAITALARRVEAEGDPGVLAYRFYADEADTTVRAVVDYRDGAAWVRHHELAMNWPQMAAWHALASLEEVLFLGDPGDGVRAWLEGSPIKDKVVQGYGALAGFSRA